MDEPPRAGGRADAARYARYRLTLALCFGLAALYAALRPPMSPPIRSDGFGYHLWLRALARGRLDFCGERSQPKWYAHLPITVTPPNAVTGRCGDIYPPGVALTKAPVLLPFVEPDEAADPSPVEQMVTSALPLALMALVVQAQLALAMFAGVDPRAATFAVMLAIFGTGYFHYAFFDASFSHAYSAFWAMATLMACRACGRVRRTLLTTVAASMLILTRNTNLLLLPLVAAVDRFLSTARGTASAVDWTGVVRDSVLLAICALPGAAVQVALNYWFEDRLTLSSYSTTGTLAFGIDHVLSIFWSYERGLAQYYPGLLVMLALLLATASTRTVGLFVSAVVVAYALLYSSWSNWMLGAGFGHRGFVEMAPLIAIPAAVAMDRTSHPRVVALAGAGAMLWCLLLMTAYWRMALPFSGVTATDYWSALAGRHLPSTSLLVILMPLAAVSVLYGRRDAAPRRGRDRARRSRSERRSQREEPG